MNFFKIIVNFFKKIGDIKNGISAGVKAVLNSAESFKKVSKMMMDEMFETNVSKEDAIPTKKELVVITPGKEDEYMNTISNLYKSDFIGEFRKISFALASLADLPLSDNSKAAIEIKIRDFEFKNKDYKEKIDDIISTLKDKQTKYLIKVDRNNGDVVIKNALNRNKGSKWGSHEIVDLLNSSNCTRMVSTLSQSIKKIQSKTTNISLPLQNLFKRLSSSFNITISHTNKLFSECFSYIKAFLSTENINTRLSKMAIFFFKK